MVEEKLVLIDTDAGIDDAWAILMCLKAHQDSESPLKILGFTCVNGNTAVDNVTRNVAQTLKIGGESNIPIYRGCETPLVLPFKYDGELFNGVDGFGDADLPPVEYKVEAEHGVNTIIRLAETYKGKLTILALAPLTNLAVAVRLQPKIKEWIKEIIFLGGNVNALGNITAVAEFNVYSDVESAHVVLEEFAGVITIVPWETCDASACSVISREELGKTPTAKMQFFNRIEANMLTKEGPGGTYYVGDQVASAVLIEPNLVKKTSNYFCTVEIGGQYSRGLVVVDKAGRKPPNCKFVETIDYEMFRRMLIWTVDGPEYKDKRF